jgi:transposase
MYTAIMPDRGATVAEIRIPEDDRELLARWARGGAGELSRRAMRARIVLACAEPGADDARVAPTLGVSRPTVACWRRRYAQAGLAGLTDAARTGRPKRALELTGAERARLFAWARQAVLEGSTRGAAERVRPELALRAKIVLACAAGASNAETAGRLDVTEATVARWRRRFLTGRLDGLADLPRPGRPPSIPPQIIQQVITRTQQQSPGNAARWSRAAMARECGLSASTIGRIWSRSGIKPHLADEKKLITTISGAKHQTNPKVGMLLAAERRELLLTRLRRDGKLVAKDLAAELGLSDDSIRRDLRDLAATGLCQRVYGGALPGDWPPGRPAGDRPGQQAARSGTGGTANPAGHHGDPGRRHHRP